MKVLILGNKNSVHLQKWCTSLEKCKIEYCIFSFNNNLPEKEGSINKLVLLKKLPTLKKMIRDFKPDVIHAHYASSYGLLAALSGFHPFYLSVWGSDVLSFPNRSIFHKMILKYNLKKADRIFATGKYLASETKKFTHKEIIVTPFGIDTEKYRKVIEPFSFFDKNDFVIGCTKSFNSIYQIDLLIKFFAKLASSHSSKRFKLLLVGDGPQKSELLKLVQNLQIKEQVLFAGAINQIDMPKYYNMMNVAVFLSKHESFGVSVLEAQACKVPVITSNCGGFRELINKNGIILEENTYAEFQEAIQRLPEISVDSIDPKYEMNSLVKQIQYLYEK